MINISNLKRLGIILPNTNKALEKVLSSATPKEIEVISKGRDLKGVMESILKQSSDETVSNKDLLQLVKNNPTLKNLGDVTTTIKELLSSLKADKNQLPIEKVLNDFLIDIKDLKTSQLKQRFENSGLFLESKLKDVKNPQVELKNTLLLLDDILSSAKSASSKAIRNEIKLLLNSEVLKDTNNSNILKNEKIESKSLENLAKNIQKLNLKIASILKDADSIHNPTLTKALDKLNYQLELKMSDSKDFKPLAFKESLQQISSYISKSLTMESKSILNTLDKIFDNIQQVSPSKLSLENLKENLNILKEKANILENTTLSKELDKIDLQNPKLSSLKESLVQVSQQINENSTMESKSILNTLDKIFKIIDGIDMSKTSLNQSLEKDISKLMKDINSVIQKADPIFSKDSQLIFKKLQTIHTQQQLNPQHNVKEIISNDLKAVLLQASKEIENTSHLNKTELLHNIEKLSLQIDHFQLLSHLSNGSSLYLPFSWDSLEDGNIEMKKTNDNRFYCDIYLKLKEYGELNLKLTLFDKNQLNLHIYSANDKFKNLIKENIPSLRSALIDIKITPREIRVFEPKMVAPISPYQNQEENIYMGFEVKA
jgi:hypothetical protein